MERTWLNLEAIQQPEYDSFEDLSSFLHILSNAPELVSLNECEELMRELSECSIGSHLALIIGDCAESFSDCTSEILRRKAKSYSEYSACFQSATGKPLILLGRLAGQFTKPRSEAFEIIHQGNSDPVKVLSYKGDLVNSINPLERTPDPKRLTQGYYHSAATLNYLRAFRVGIYTAHEALHIKYEDALTRSVDSGFYNAGAHFVWVGEKTRKLGNAHIEYLSKIRNPVGVKVGPNVNTAELVEIIKKLSPGSEKGKVVLILRLGAQKCRSELCRIFAELGECAAQVIWLVDPMHGNTYKAANGYKTRNYSDIFEECATTIEVFQQSPYKISGLMLEASYTEVTEVVGQGITLNDLPNCYSSLCDPRLNYSQTLQILTEVGNLLK